MKEGRREEAEAAKAEVGRLKDRSKSLEEQMAESEKKQNDLLVLLPNLPCAQVPEGRTADDNVVVKLVGDIPDLGENPLPHWELVKNLDIIDFDLGVKLTGAGFPGKNRTVFTYRKRSAGLEKKPKAASAHCPHSRRDRAGSGCCDSYHALRCFYHQGNPRNGQPVYFR